MPTIVQLELSKWLGGEVGEERAHRQDVYTQKCVVVPLDTAIALLAADLHREHKLGLYRRCHRAEAFHHRAELLTCDAHFRAPTVVFFAKSE